MPSASYNPLECQVARLGVLSEAVRAEKSEHPRQASCGEPDSMGLTRLGPNRT